MLHRSALIDAETRRFRANVYQRRAVFLVILGERRFRGRKLFEDHIGHD